MNPVEMKKQIRELISEKFSEDKEVPPTIFVWTKEELVIIPVGHLMNNKDLISIIIDQARTVSPFVCWTSEAWMVVRDSVDETVNVIPAECPDRMERVILYFYEPLSMEFWIADIDRKGKQPTMGEWVKTQYTHMEGRFAKPNPLGPSVN